MEKLQILESLLDNKSAVVFDFDNIIVDSEPYHMKAYEKAFASEGHKIDPEEYWLEWTFKGGGAEGEISRHNLKFDPDYIRSKKDPVYSGFCKNGSIRILPAALRIIEILKENDFSLAIASGSYQHDILSIIEAKGIGHNFEAVIGKDMVSETKPHPATYLKASSELGARPYECLAIEDAQKGITSAHEAGMKVIAVETKVTKGFNLEEGDLVVSELEELQRLLENLFSSK
ncbi:MAG: HAD family phosphatase [Candidatus Krumholzibacteriota bacterium]|nr:HAD family phosphatase [Candidatus Krumholzibacteriota bacterium]